MTSPLRVLQVVTKMERGGLETFIMNMYRNIDRLRIQFDFLYHRNGCFAYDNEIKELGGRIYHVPQCNPFSFRYIKMVNNFFLQHPYQVVHSHIDCMSALPLAAAKRHGVAVRIAHSHSSRQDKDFKYPLKLICKRFIRREATDLFACGVDAGRWMFNTDDFIVVNNAIDVDTYEFDYNRRICMRRELGISGDTLVVGHVGRFAPAKNHEFILDVFSEVVRLCSDSILILAGDGDLRLEMEHKAEVLGIADNVLFLGVRPDVPSLMQAMDVFLMPSVYEGLPLVLVEAQAAGLPCLISNSIPCDCNFKGSVLARKSLAESPSSWAAALVSMRVKDARRATGVTVVREAGFDAKVEAGRLAGFYLERLEGGYNERRIIN